MIHSVSTSRDWPPSVPVTPGEVPKPFGDVTAETVFIVLPDVTLDPLAGWLMERLGDALGVGVGVGVGLAVGVGDAVGLGVGDGVGVGEAVGVADAVAPAVGVGVAVCVGVGVGVGVGVAETPTLTVTLLHAWLPAASVTHTVSCFDPVPMSSGTAKLPDSVSCEPPDERAALPSSSSCVPPSETVKLMVDGL
jgi:hypothetical protein